MSYKHTACLTALAISAAMLSNEAYCAQTVTVNTQNVNGEITHGATGFLYGLGDPGIPSQQVLSALHPVTAAQKAPDGIQHPNGDALKTAEQFFNAGGKEMQVYMQDIYKEWPYEKLGIQDYLPKIRTMVEKGKASPYRKKLAWIPLNEPDVIWYNDSLLFRDYCADWKSCYEAIKEVDPEARIVGPNTTLYNERFMERFIKFAKENNCLPDIITWHELQNDFFTDWEKHYAHYRELEKKYDVKERQITINEYARFSGDLAMPGKLVQFISRFENTGVNGCLAYWTTAGSLNDLVTHNSYPTGAWWLYYWYAHMNGERLNVNLQKPFAEGLQALASFDKKRNQLHVILGGTSESVLLNLEEADKKFNVKDGEKLFVTAKKTGSSSLNPSVVPAVILEGEQTVSDGALNISIPHGSKNDAYEIIVTKNDTKSSESAVRKSMWTFNAREELVTGNTVEFASLVTEPGYYRVNVKGTKETDLFVNGINAGKVLKDSCIDVYLGEGITLFNAKTPSSEEAEKLCVTLSKLQALSDEAAPVKYEAESSANEMSSRVTVNKKGNLIEHKRPGNEEQFLRFNSITVKNSGLYAVTVRYQNGELGDGASNYNANVVDRSAFVSVNQNGTEKPKEVFFRNTLGWKDFYTTTILLKLKQGENSITFTSPAKKMLPTFDWIEVAPFTQKNNSAFKTVNAPCRVQSSPCADIKLPSEINLSVIANDDYYDSKELNYLWECKTEGVEIKDKDKCFASAAVSKPGTYVFTCKVSDGESSAKSSVNARVLPEGLYEAESEENTLTGTARIAASANASNSKAVGYIGDGKENTLTFNNVKADKNGTHTVTVSYISGENRTMLLSANDGKTVTVNCPSTGSWTTVGTIKVKLKLVKGMNTITVSNASAYAPDIDCILIEP